MQLIHRHMRLNARRAPLARCEEGVTAIEFALIAPVFFLMLIGIIEFSMIMFTSSLMESATGTTARLGKTGYVASGISREQTLLNMLRDRTDGFLDQSKFVVTNTVYSNFDKIGQPEPFIDSNGNGTRDPGETYSDSNGNGQWDADMGTAGLGNAGDIVVYTITYPWPVLTPLAQAILGSTYEISARAVVKNEPYDVSGL